MGNLERAKIYELDSSGSIIQPGMDVCFNPKEYDLNKTVTWDTSKAFTDAPKPEFKAPQAQTLKVTLQFDTYEERVSVRDKYIRRIEKLANMSGTATDAKDAKNHAPPELRFVWGAMSFRGVIQTMAQKYTMFLSDGTPVRCDVDITMMNVEDLNTDTGTDLTQKTAGSTTNYTIQAGDRLDLIAADKLGDASRWSEIAALNGIDNPADLTEGNSIQIPVD